MPFEKGHKKSGGRPKGALNTLTKQMKTVKESVLAAFHELQKDPKVNIVTWGQANPKEFYQIAAKLIPTELTGEFNANIIKIVDESDNGANSKAS